MKDLTPKQIVEALDRHIIGQADAKKAVAIALRNRWRRQQLDPQLAEEVLPKNILMIGPTGVGKTEIARRLARLANAPFIKVEATKFTEVGYVGRDVESIIRDLTEISVNLTRKNLREAVKDKAKAAARERVIDALAGKDAGEATREKFGKEIDDGSALSKEIDISVADSPKSAMPTFDIPGMPGAQMGMLDLGDMMSKAMGGKRSKKKRMTVEKALEVVELEEADKLLDEEKIVAEALNNVMQNGIVFIDEIDKIARGSERRGGDVSREGVQRDLLPLIEGTVVSTKHGTVRTDHILFICSGAFHLAKPADLLPELQGRLPNRVELKSLTEDDFKRILIEPEASLIKQYIALLNTEGVTLTFDDEAVDEIARLAVQINREVEEIGARRLHTVLERILEEVSFDADTRSGSDFQVTKTLVQERLEDLAKDADLSKFIL